MSAIVLVDKAFRIGSRPLPDERNISYYYLSETITTPLSVFIREELPKLWCPDVAFGYKVIPLPARLKNPPNQPPNLTYTPAKHILPTYTGVIVKFNPMDDYKRQQPLLQDQQNDMVYVLEMCRQPELFTYFNEHTTEYLDSPMTALLSLIVQPKLDKFKDRLHYRLPTESFKPVMRFCFWFFTYHRIHGCFPKILYEFNDEAIKEFAAVNVNNPFVQQFTRVNVGMDDFDYDAVCKIFEDCFHFLPQEQPLEVPDLYISSLDGLELSPAMAALLTNMAEYKLEEDSAEDLCFWSQPSVNHRDFDLLRIPKLRDGFLNNPKNVKGLSSEDYTCFPYVVAEKDELADGNATSMMVESMVKSAKLKKRLVAESFCDQTTEAEKFYKFVTGEEFDQTALDNADMDDHGPFKILASALHIMNKKYNGLGSQESLRQLYRDLLKPLFSVDPFPTEAMNIMSEDYRQLFHCCRIVFQASFPFRLGMIDGGHRIVTALAAIYNLNPTPHPKALPVGFLGSNADNPILDLGKLCVDVRFRMGWPNCPLVNNKQKYDLSVSLSASVSADIRKNEHCAYPHSVPFFCKSIAFSSFARHHPCWGRILRICRRKRVIQKSERSGKFYDHFWMR
jgi:hypothetical protein